VQPTPDVSGLRIGVYDDDGFVRATPAMRRAVHEAGARLTAAGAQVVPFAPPHQRELVELYLAAISSAALATARRQFGTEPLSPSLKLMWRLGMTPIALLRVIAGGLRRVGEDRLARVINTAGRKSVDAFWRLTARRTELCSAVEDAWRMVALDAVICPASATPAGPIDMASDAGLIFSYLGRYNMLRMPAGVVPTTFVRADETQMSVGQDRVDTRIAAISAQSAGLPVAVQVLAPRWRDQTALAVMSAVETGLGI
jgi:Asp-tRNA(Asn)/Glu-tRNA(Gln) amidotransferase A subunit family amidase